MIETEYYLINPNFVRIVTKSKPAYFVRGITIMFKDSTILDLDEHSDNIDPEQIYEEIRTKQSTPISFPPIDFEGHLINRDHLILAVRLENPDRVSLWFIYADKPMVIKTNNVEALWNLLKGEGS